VAVLGLGVDSEGVAEVGSGEVASEGAAEASAAPDMGAASGAADMAAGIDKRCSQFVFVSDSAGINGDIANLLRVPA
jgi:hypothetical protein